MYSFNQLDYVGDAVLRIISFELGVQNAAIWKWHRNKELAKLYDAIFLMLTYEKKQKKLRMRKSLHDHESCIVQDNRVRSIHQKASYVEAWIGEEFLLNGLEGARNFFFRLLKVTGNEKF